MVANEVCPSTDRFNVVYDRPLTAEEFAKVKEDSVRYVHSADGGLQPVTQEAKVLKPKDVLEQFELAKQDPNWVKMSDLLIQEMGEAEYSRYYDNPNLF